ncbi:bifunctional UDP-N-acetylglucosamine diphosphorylase/glucosamine-1-phosphate N-acetyltransferase GlmU [Paenibacillus koleovorans]|uniref:bifunctional UDP-N-acetylglucosamine diphosphorylase/glucosamine-1-phosphate N-acetyltransferase GlmU n=1 Tax=Paenibacillus koleovorans TaxID=121608 RepID=UPI000FD8B568|nr:bifunctional UDP-N-acetylglucosamine diphosphorylase/glucosamine-1-phosphate N-acetyltransferase GlmU [Paenibacillus koleovorans]
MRILGIVLAAGQGKRMKSKLYKVMHPVCGKPLVGHVVDVLDEVNADRKVVIVGHGAETVKAYLGDRAEYAMQAEQLGTGHAAMQAEALLEGEDGIALITTGDTPLISADSLGAMIRQHIESGASASVLTAMVDQPFGYGRIVRNADGLVTAIVEQKDCTPEQQWIREINTGIGCFDKHKLFQALKQLKNDNAQREYLLTDVFGILAEQGDKVLGYCTADATEGMGINDRVQLSEAERVMRGRINRRHMLNGVTIIDPSNTYIEKEVQIGADTVVYPGTFLRGVTVIGEDCMIGPHADMTNTVVRNGTTVQHSVLTDATVGEETAIGPFAYLRPGSRIGNQVKIGDFVEIKNAELGDGTKVSHLSYVGDAVVGKNVNIGCGAITVNYDGYNKNITEICDDAFVGSNVNLIAPVRIGEGAYVVAGSTITHEVPAGDLAIARERQTNKPGYADKLRQRFKAIKAKKQESK